ncbi:ABC transporter ATP-binding protein [Mesobacterium pallidum]|uniref:ABC transporter ATP-binding protein n=1 Tax=Mesobacterium pallidum TaxID=2872037 RepID=UPI001EE1925C|nr:ABC transporter ATP-binding protein [Mesobacterium pallidum]
MAFIKIDGLRKVYDGGFEALKGVDLEIEEGEILALLGPNGAGKTTLISTICGMTTPTAGSVTVGGHDIIRDWRAARSLIGLVPQEINIEPFTEVRRAVAFSRGLFGLKRNDAHVDDVLRRLSLTDKADSKIMQLSGGMKRRVLIAKALAHEPRVLFLDEPTAGVDVELRKSMWETVAELKKQGVTIILTTHYIEEAEAIADRIAVINKGEILLVERKDALMKRLGRKRLVVELQHKADALPDSLVRDGLALSEDGLSITYDYDTQAERTGITRLLQDLSGAGLTLRDLQTRQSSLEDIFVGLVAEQEQEGAA